MKKYILTTLFFLFCFSVVFSQSRGKKKEANPTEAKDNFSLQNYRGALDDYLLLVEKEPTNVLYNYRLAFCYLNTNIDKAKAVSYLEFVSSLPKCDDIVWYDLARAYMYGYKFDKALATFTKYKQISRSKDLFEEVDHHMENCYTAKEKVKYPINVTWQNLGKEVNSEYPDLNPFVNADETFLAFTTKRKGTLGGFANYDGYPTSDIFCSEEKGGKWTKAKTVGAKCNSEGNDEVTSLTPDGEYLFIYTETDVFGGDIWVSKKKGKAYQPRAILEENINKSSIEIGASIYQEGDVLFYNSNASDGLGGFDIYMARKLPNGQFATPINLGSNINTKYDEDYPVVSSDGTTLYFASKGHSNMGGYDLFKSTWNPEESKWGPAINLGYPINTPDDNLTISFDAKGQHAYIAAVREKGLGDLDIYRLTFSAVEPSYTAIRGLIKTVVKADYNEYKDFYYYSKNNKIVEFSEEYKPSHDPSWKFVETKRVLVKEGFEYRASAIFAKADDTDPNVISIVLADGKTEYLKEMKNTLIKKANYIAPPPNSRPEFVAKGVSNATITLLSKEKGDVIGEYLPNPTTGKYIMIASPGKYTMNVTAEGFKPFSTDIEVLDLGSFRDEVEYDVVLHDK